MFVVAVVVVALSLPDWATASMASMAAAEFAAARATVDAILLANLHQQQQQQHSSAFAAAVREFADESRIAVSARALPDETSAFVLLRRGARARKCLSVPPPPPTVHRFDGSRDLVAWVRDVLHWPHPDSPLARAAAAFAARALRNPSACRYVDAAPSQFDVFTALADNQPTVFRGAVAHWPARTLWTPARLREESGDVELFVKVSDGKFEGVENATLWPADELPAFVREHLLDASVVVVRAADLRLTMREFLHALKTAPNGTSFYLEYCGFHRRVNTQIEGRHGFPGW